MSDEVIAGVAPDGTAFDLTGPGGAQLLVLIHGLGLCRELWQSYLPEFSRKYRVLNYDLIGHGASTGASTGASAAAGSANEGDELSVTLTSYSDQLARLLDHLDAENLALGPAVVVGFSIGGMINRRFAMDHSEKVAALVIMNSPHDRGEALQSQVEQRAKTVNEQGAMATMPDALKRWFTADFLEASKAKIPDQKNQLAINPPELVCEWRQRVDKDSYAQAAWVLANGVRELIDPVTPITSPALVLTCENDSGSTPQMSRDIASELVDAKLLVVPRLQHLGLMQEPDLFSRPILDFLEERLT